MSINVIVVEKNKKAYVKQLPGTTDSLKKEMESGIEFVKLATDNSVVLVVTTNNTNFSEMNRALYHPGSKKVAEVVCGKFLIVGVDDKDNITNLTNKQIRRYMARFGEPEIFKIRKRGEILAVKLSDVEKQKQEKKKNALFPKVLYIVSKHYENHTSIKPKCIVPAHSLTKSQTKCRKI